MKKIVLTGGGTAGHVTPNIAIIEDLKNFQYEIHYIGQKNSIEEQLIKAQGDSIPFHRISAGKLRRNADFKDTMKNIGDVFKVAVGFSAARNILANVNPDVVFSKGGFVAVPVVLAARSLKIPVVIHESDITPGLTNKITLKFAENICVSFKETAVYIKKNYKKDSVITGTPIRKNLVNGDKTDGSKLCDFSDDTKPVLLVVGGSQGARSINNIVRSNLMNGKLDMFNVIHITGPNGEDTSIKKDNYRQFGYVNDELKNLYAYADYFVSRAGANTIFEILELKKPNLLIPLSKKVSRGDQIDNAMSFQAEGYSLVLFEEDLTDESFNKSLEELVQNKDVFISNMQDSTIQDTSRKIVRVINASFRTEKEV